MKRYKNAKKKIDIGVILVTLILYAILGTVYGVMLWGWVKVCSEVYFDYTAINSGIIVEAELTKVQYYSSDSDYVYHDSSHVPYYVIYEYQDGDIKYQGTGISNIRGKENAEAFIGQKIKIHIDGKGHSIAVGGKPAVYILVILTILVVVLFYPMLFWPLLMRQINSWQEKNKAKKEQSKYEDFKFSPFGELNGNSNKKE